MNGDELNGLHAAVDVAHVSLLGLEVGSKLTGFHACILRGGRIVGGPLRCPTPLHVVELARTHEVFLVGIDAPADTYGVEMRTALAAAGFACVEVSSTATATHTAGPRGDRAPARWTAAAVAALGLKGLASNLTQQQRDCVLAAYSAREHVAGRSEMRGTIIVPRKTDPKQ